MKFLFLDIDGVLNDHARTPSGYCGLQADKIAHLNFILEQEPEVRLVISSAWRYIMLRGDMTLRGFEYLLLQAGLKAWDRLHGHTAADGTELGHYDPDAGEEEKWREAGLLWRWKLCHEYAEAHAAEQFVILDDLALESPHLVKVDGSVGLTREIAEEVIRRFRS